MNDMIRTFMHTMHYGDNAVSGIFTFKEHTKLKTETWIDIFLHTLLNEDNLYNVQL